MSAKEKEHDCEATRRITRDAIALSQIASLFNIKSGDNHDRLIALIKETYEHAYGKRPKSTRVPGGRPEFRCALVGCEEPALSCGHWDLCSKHQPSHDCQECGSTTLNVTMTPEVCDECAPRVARRRKKARDDARPYRILFHGGPARRAMDMEIQTNGVLMVWWKESREASRGCDVWLAKDEWKEVQRVKREAAPSED